MTNSKTQMPVATDSLFAKRSGCSAVPLFVIALYWFPLCCILRASALCSVARWRDDLVHLRSAWNLWFLFGFLLSSFCKQRSCSAGRFWEWLLLRCFWQFVACSRLLLRDQDSPGGRSPLAFASSSSAAWTTSGNYCSNVDWIFLESLFSNWLLSLGQQLQLPLALFHQSSVDL